MDEGCIDWRVLGQRFVGALQDVNHDPQLLAFWRSVDDGLGPRPFG